jgi:hypothetical protein
LGDGVEKCFDIICVVQRNARCTIGEAKSESLGLEVASEGETDKKVEQGRDRTSLSDARGKGDMIREVVVHPNL